eukprot:1831375-Prymnesium_polylepis.1
MVAQPITTHVTGGAPPCAPPFSGARLAEHHRLAARQAAQGHLRPAVRQEVRHHGRRPQYARAADVRRPAT